jgi:fatty-acyl-CoA synthase
VREDGTLAEPHELGEIVHTGMGVMQGYLDGDNPQNKVRPNPFFGPEDDAARAVFTGDQGYLDEDGYLYLVGRRDEMLKVSGNRFYPRAVSDQLLTIDGVAEAEVVGVTLDDDDTRLVAFVVREPSSSLQPMMIRRELALYVPSFMLPEHVVILCALPRTANGKPDRQALTAQAAALLTHK